MTYRKDFTTLLDLRAVKGENGEIDLEQNLTVINSQLLWLCIILEESANQMDNYLFWEPLINKHRSRMKLGLY